MDEHEDVIGRAIKPGDVIVKFNRSNRSAFSQIGVVRELLANGYILWQFVSNPINPHEDRTLSRPSTFFHTDQCVIVPLTEEDLRERYHLAETGE